jgi:HlyD family secretion protein
MHPEPECETANADHRRYARLGYGAIAMVFGGFGIWAALAPLDRAAIAPGQVAVESDRKAVQHLEGGIIREILVKDTQLVKEGDVLFRLQPTQAQANTDLLRKQLDAALALEARLNAEKTGADTVVFPETVLARMSIPETATAVADQRRQFSERRASLQNQIDILNKQIEQKRQDMSGRKQQRASLVTQVESYTKQMKAVEPLVVKGYYARNQFAALERERARLQGDLALAESDIARTSKTIEETQLQIGQTRQKFDEDVSQQLADDRAKISDMREKLVIAEDVLKRVDVVAQRSGIVLGLKVHTIGAVVKPGDTLAEIVPVNENLEVMARVAPVDIDTVAIGQKAEVRFPNFSSRRTPTILGQVASVAADAVEDQTTHQSYYSTRVVIDYKTIAPELAQKILPGMQADVLISTGERTMFQYLTGPMLNAFAKTGREK